MKEPNFRFYVSTCVSIMHDAVGITYLTFAAQSAEKLVRFEFMFLVRYHPGHLEYKSRFRLLVQTIERTYHSNASW